MPPGRRPEQGEQRPTERATTRGTLFVVGTPIGHLDDLSPRAVETLRRCRLIACEDTRVTRGMLHRHQIRTAVMSCHRFNEASRATRILSVLDAGGDVALVSDGGTPGVSDPGAAVVRAVRAAGAVVSPVPGPSAVTALWSVSGFPGGPFTVVGFLPQRSGERRRALEALRTEARPLVFFESPHRILGMLGDAREVLGDRPCFLGREMTKIHEEFLAGSLGVVRDALAARAVRGEFTLIVAADPSAAPGAESARTSRGGGGTEHAVAAPEQLLQDAGAEVRRLVERGVERRAALRRVARATGLSRRALYAQLVRDRGRRDTRGSAEEE